MKTERSELRAYLLGQLPEPAAAEMDARLFADNDLHREMEDEQELLIEDFVANRLPKVDDSIFRAQCAASPELEDRVNSLRVLLTAIDRTAPPAVLLDEPFAAPPQRLKIVPSSRRRGLFFGSQALAASLLIIGFLYFRETRKSAHQTAQPQVPQMSTRPLPNSSDGRPIFTAFLSADVPRGSSATTEFAIPANASTLEIEVELHNGSTPARRWNVQLVCGKEVIWTSANIPTQKAGQKQYLSLRIGREKLSPGSYVVRYTPSENAADIQRRTFRITEDAPSASKPE